MSDPVQQAEHTIAEIDERVEAWVQRAKAKFAAVFGGLPENATATVKDVEVAFEHALRHTATDNPYREPPPSPPPPPPPMPEADAGTAPMPDAPANDQSQPPPAA